MSRESLFVVPVGEIVVVSVQCSASYTGKNFQNDDPPHAQNNSPFPRTSCSPGQQMGFSLSRFFLKFVTY